jgi:hypothetical protein
MKYSARFLLLGFVLATTAVAADKSPLAEAPSAFVRAQAGSAVHWQPWTDAVLEQAKKQDKPVYVFVGSQLSELTRATINQTFTSEKTVTWLNENFFCIFVDADAQPDVAAYAQHFIATVKQLKGSPVHLWLTPDTLKPYDGANYLPPSEEWGKPGFLKAARSALDAWKMEPARARALSGEALEMMKLPPLGTGEAKPEAIQARLDKAAAAWIATIDAKNGGFGSAPKLPEPELIRFLLKRDKAAQDAAINAARALVNGALDDPVDGGFYRRCIDEEWKEPYYQKTLIDQARIALALFEAADVAKDDKLRAAGIRALDFALKELRNPDGTFAAALDGTLEENADPAKRPKFVKVGSASSGALTQVIVALQRSGEKSLVALAGKMTAELPLHNKEGKAQFLFWPAHSAQSETPVPADWLGSAWAMRLLPSETHKADEVLALANQIYFDPTSGAYMAAPAKLPSGIAARVPASGDTPSAEVLALLAGVDEKTAGLIRRNLMNQIEYDELPPGDVLLGLSQK